MLLNKKKIWLGLGTIIATAAPIATVVACGDSGEPNQEYLDNKQLLKSDETLRRVEEKWQILVLKEQDPKFDETKIYEYMKPSIINQIKMGLISDRKYLWKIATSLMETDAMKDAAAKAGKTTFELANNWGLLQVASMSKIAGLQSNATSTDKKVDEKALKMLFKEVKDFRTLIFKTVICEGFINKGMDKTEFKKQYLTEDGESFSNIQRLVKDDKNFFVTDLIIKNHYFLNFEYSLNAKQSQQFITNIAADKEKTYADMLTAIKTGGEINTALDTFTTKRQVTNDDLLVGDHSDLIAYGGIVPLSGTRGIMKQDDTGFKNATNPDMWKGFMVDSELKYDPSLDSPAGTDKIPLFPTTGSTPSKTVHIQYVEGIMPFYDKSNASDPHLTMEGTPWFKNGKAVPQLVQLLANDPTMYDQAKEYYTKRETKPILLEIVSPELKDIVQRHGFDFIKED